jgi:hypothetical protein
MKIFPDPQRGQYGSVQSYSSRTLKVSLMDSFALAAEAFVFFGRIAILLYWK